MCALSGELIIDLAAVRENYRRVDALSAASCETGVAVKADAYGVGMAAVAPALWDAGARTFFVATLAEGVALRGLVPHARIAVLNGFAVSAAADYLQYDLSPVLNSLYEIEACRNFLALGEKGFSVFLHFDTGMNRLGIKADEARRIFEDMDMLRGLDVACVMSHLVSSEDKESPLNLSQLRVFGEIAQRFPLARKSLCNSGGVFHCPAGHYDLTRCGLALYGGNPAPEGENPLLPVVSLSVPVLQVHSVNKGETVGYNGTYCFEENGFVAVASIGYADGFFRAHGNSSALYWKGYRLPIRGRVSMDLVICDLGAVPQAEYPAPYEMLEVIGPHQDIETLAAGAGTISYEILTALGSRYSRVYLDQAHIGR